MKPKLRWGTKLLRGYWGSIYQELQMFMTGFGRGGPQSWPLRAPSAPGVNVELI